MSRETVAPIDGADTPCEHPRSEADADIGRRGATVTCGVCGGETAVRYPEGREVCPECAQDDVTVVGPETSPLAVCSSCGASTVRAEWAAPWAMTVGGVVVAVWMDSPEMLFFAALGLGLIAMRTTDSDGMTLSLANDYGDGEDGGSA
jgi:transcription elongation factor Elf1